MTKSKIFFILSLSFIGGIFSASFYFPKEITASFILLMFLPALILAAVFYQNKKILLAGFCWLFFILGIFLTEKEIAKFNYLADGKNFSGIVVIAKDPEMKDKVQNIIVRPENSTEKFLLNGSVYKNYAYGDKLNLSCLLTIPENRIGVGPSTSPSTSSGSAQDEASSFDYRMYLAKEGVFYLCKSPKVENLNANEGNRIYKIILNAKNKLNEKINQFLPMPESGLLTGLLIGGSENLPQKVKDDFSTTGMTHIVAVSGFNVTIVAEHLMILGIFLGLWRKQAFWFAVAGIFLFVFMTGFPASAVRAGLMGGLLLWAMKNGRLANSQNAILFAAAAMLFWNPLLLRWDVGFQLSFLATLGIVYFYPLLENYLIRKNKVLTATTEIIFLTMSAIIFVTPVIIYNFHKFSVVALLANLLILPIIPATMLLGFLMVLASFIFSPLAQVLAWLTFLPLKYETGVISFLASLRWASVEIQNFSWMFVVGWYIILAGILFYKIPLSLLPKKVTNSNET